MRNVLRVAFSAFGLGIALQAATLRAAEPCCSITDAVEAACSAPCQGCTACEEQDVTCACEEYCRCCSGECSLWNAYVGVIFLTRDSSAGPLLENANIVGDVFLSGDNFNFNSDAGVDTTIARRLANGDSIEFRYFGVDNIAASASVLTPDFTDGLSLSNALPFVSADLSYSTQVKSLEANYKHTISERLSLLGGFRFVELNDNLYYTLLGTPAPFNLALENKMYGGQIGLDWLLTDPRNALELRVIGKAGWYYNDYSLLYRDFFGPVASSSDGTSFVGDLNFSAAYWFNNHIALRAGYQLLWMGDVALAGNEASRSITDWTLLNNPMHDGDIFMHGATIGLEVQW